MPAALRLSAQLGLELCAALLAGCGSMTQPEDVEIAADLCGKRGGFTHLARYERGKLLTIICKDETRIEIRPGGRA